MKKTPEIHRRRSIRLKGYDYSRAGMYFITICAQDRLCLFGEIEQGEMKNNDAGQMVNTWWYELNHKYRNIELHERIVMPNHFHGIIEIKSGGHSGPPLHAMVQWFKTMTTNDYIRGIKNNNWPRFYKKLWQRNYYEHIIRNEISHHQIAEYVQTNPLKWLDDLYFVDNRPGRN